MKALLLVLVAVAGFGYYFYYYRPQHLPPPPPAENTEAATPTPAASAAATAKRGFDDLTALLRQDMEAIPSALDGPGRPPNNAVAIKRKIGSHVSKHAEYATLVQACDVIILADSQRASYQQACRTEQSRTFYGTSLSSGGSMDRPTSTQRTPTPDPKVAQVAIHDRVEGAWQKQREQSSTQVQQLLASLAGKSL